MVRWLSVPFFPSLRRLAGNYKQGQAFDLHAHFFPPPKRDYFKKLSCAFVELAASQFV